ncbi:MAG: hypothetical protein ACE5LU_04030 [Anaerolineae bacterium]
MSVGFKILERMRYFIDVEGNTPTQEQPFTVALREGHIGVEAEVIAYDSLGVALHGLTVWGDGREASLEALAQTISRRVTYLWEPLALIERDLEREQVQMRSAPPLIEDKTVEYYEAMLTRQEGSPRIHMARYRQQNGQTRRVRVPITLTHQVFRRLVDDLVTILRALETE